jgi:hypothetical protein
MYPDILTPQKSKQSSTKDQIIEILSYYWPLTVKKIYYSLKKEYSRSITYQAAYKAINQLIDNNVIIKKENGYQLDLKWVKEVHNQTEIIRVNYFSEKQAAIFEQKESIHVFIFKTWFDVEKYLYYLQKSHISSLKEPQTICVHHNHEWRPLFYLRAEYNWLKKLKEGSHKTYVLSSGNSILDKWASNFYKKSGVKIKLGQKCAEPAEIMVFSDIVVQCYIPLDLRESLDEEFKKAKKVVDLDFYSLINNIFEKESEIKVVVNHDKNLANQIIKQTLSYF